MTRFRQETGMEKANLKRVLVQIVYIDEVIVEIYDYIRGWILSLKSLVTHTAGAYPNFLSMKRL